MRMVGGMTAPPSVRELFENTSRPESALFYSRNDPHDRKLGDAVASERDRYENSRFVLLGSPQDEGVRRNQGRPGAAEAPNAIRSAFYRFPAPAGLGENDLFDLGDISMQDTLEDTHEVQRKVVAQLLADGKYLIILGGGNDISFPDCAALSEWADGRLTAFNVDSHYDVRSSPEPHSGSSYRQLLEEGYLRPSQLYQMAAKPLTNSPEHEKYLNEKGVAVYPLESLRDEGIKEVFERILESQKADAIFWGFDIDAVRTQDAPGASATYPVGLTAEEICKISKIAGADERSRILEITEVNPRHDLDQRTARLAAMIALYYIAEKVGERSV
jgi:formiminoglutamase